MKYSRGFWVHINLHSNATSHIQYILHWKVPSCLSPAVPQAYATAVAVTARHAAAALGGDADADHG